MFSYNIITIKPWDQNKNFEKHLGTEIYIN